MRRFLWIVVVGLLTYVIANRYIVETVQVVGFSMSPTLGDSKMYLLNHFVYLYRSPRPGDVVVIRDPVDGMLSVKRIVGKPGDAVGFLDGKVVVNGVVLSEPYLEPKKRTHAENEAHIDSSTTVQFRVCGKDEYFVLGDNRNHSVDSRAFGPVKRAGILGMVVR